MKLSEKYTTLNEMSMKDVADIVKLDLSSPSKIAKAYVEAYKKNNPDKEFTVQAAGSIKKSFERYFAKLGVEQTMDLDAVSTAARELAGLGASKSKAKKSVEESTLEEMAAADLEGIDLEGTPEEIAKAYIENYKKRTKKEFTAQAAASMKKAIDRDDIDAIVAAARKYADVKPAKSHADRSKESNEKRAEAEAGKKDVMAKNVEDQVKKAHDVYKEMKEDIMKNSGLKLINESKGSKEEQIAFINSMKAKLKSNFSEEVKEEIATEKDEQGKNNFEKESIKIIKKEVFGSMVYRIEEGLSMKFDKVLLSKKEISEILKSILSKGLSESVITEGAKSKTAKCPICGEKYLVKTGYCLSCKKKVASVEKKSDDEGDQEAKSSCATDDKKKAKK